MSKKRKYLNETQIIALRTKRMGSGVPLPTGTLKKQKQEGPWVAYLRKRPKVTVGAIYRGPLMLYINYQGFSRCLQDDFQDFPILLYINQICPQAGPHFILGA